MRRTLNRWVSVLSDATSATIDPLRHPPQGISVHRHNDGSDTGGCGQDPVVDRLVAGCGRGMRDCPRPHHLRRLQRNDPGDELLTVHRGRGRMDRDDLVEYLLVRRHGRVQDAAERWAQRNTASDESEQAPEASAETAEPNAAGAAVRIPLGHCTWTRKAVRTRTSRGG